MIRSSWPWKSSWRSSASTASSSSGGSGWFDSQQRPLIPNRSETGGFGIRLRCRIACTWFLSLVRWRTRCARRATCRRSACVCLVGHPHRRQIVGREQLREDRRVDLVGLDLRLGDRAGLHRVRDHHPRDPRADQLHDRVRVARRLDRDLIRRPRLSANTRIASGVVAICPA